MCRYTFSSAPTRSLNDGVDGPLAASRCQGADWSETSSERGAIHGRDYDNRNRLGETCFSGAWRRCGRVTGSAQAAAPWAAADILQPPATVCGGAGGLRHGALLGARITRTWA